MLAPYKYRRARHLLFTLPPGPENGRALLRELLPKITHGASDVSGVSPWLCNIGITCEGLRRLQCDAALLANLDEAFQAGPDPVSLSDIAGSESDRANWWDGQWQTRQIHLLVQIYTREGDQESEAESSELTKATNLVLAAAAAAGWQELLPRKTPDHNKSLRLNGAALPRDPLDVGKGAKVHFGYRDGLSQPEIDWDVDLPGDPLDPLGLPNPLNRSNFLLGYNRTEPPAVSEFFRDSSYLVLRWLQQDVAAFENFLTAAAPALSPDRPLAEGREFVAAKLMGRWRDGTPLTLSPDQPNPSLNTTPFDFQKQDADGSRCPFGAHIRVVNPRDQPLSHIKGVPRVIRRGMPYGPEMPKWTGGPTPDDGIERGIVGAFLCTNIAQQIYTLTQWISRTNFSDVFSPGHLHDQDSLFGNRKVPRAGTKWNMPSPGGALPSLPDFVRTRGTAFFMLPSMKALQELAK